MNRNYEVVFITNPATSEARLTELHARNKQIIENAKGKILLLDDWGKRKLSFPIKKEMKGHYFCLTYSADTTCVAEMERNMRINEDVFRFLTVKIDEKIDPMVAIQEYKNKLEARARMQKERAEEEKRRRDEEASMHESSEE
jgi:small subunit ribosomal protein S6